jgi:hypothetical protein
MPQLAGNNFRRSVSGIESTIDVAGGFATLAIRGGEDPGELASQIDRLSAELGALASIIRSQASGTDCDSEQALLDSTPLEA